MQCDFIKVIRMKRGSSNCKMTETSKNIFCDKYKYIHKTCPMEIKRAVKMWAAFRQLFYTVPKKLNTLHRIVKAEN